MRNLLSLSLCLAITAPLVACGDDAPANKAVIGAVDSGSNPSDGGSNPDGSTNPTTDGGKPADDGGSSMADGGKPADDGGSMLADSGPAIADCTGYCTNVMANCTAGNAQYPTMGACMAFCSSMPQGKPGDLSGDSVECRAYHGGAPSQSMPASHCSHAGPTGGDNVVTDSNPGTCGEGCEAFCNMAQATCTGPNQQWAHTVDCLADCKTFNPIVGSYSITVSPSANNFGCRVYHLSAAAAGSAGATTHCPHIIKNSPVCNQ